MCGASARKNQLFERRSQRKVMRRKALSCGPPAISSGCSVMNIPLRRTGVNILGDIPWSSHLCVFYESQDGLFDSVIPYFKAGLESNEFCLWALPPSVTQEKAHAALSLRIPDFDQYLEAGKIELTLAEEWYLEGGHFDTERVSAACDEKLQTALAKGFDGVRASGTAFWLHARFCGGRRKASPPRRSARSCRLPSGPSTNTRKKPFASSAPPTGHKPSPPSCAKS
jgi:hypothetical protein